MAASSQDRFTRVGTPGSATTLAAPGHTIGGTAITVGSTSNWDTITGQIFAMDTVTIVNGKEVRDVGSYTEWEGVVSSSTSVTSLVLRYGTDQNYPAGSTTRVYIPVSSSRENRLVDGILVQHNQDGTHGAVTATSLSTDTLTEKTPASGVTIDGLNVKDGKLNTNDSVVTSNLTNDSVTPAKMLGIDLFGVTAAQSGTAPVAGTGQFYIQSGTTIGSFASNALDITFPTPFPNGLLSIITSNGDSVGTNPITVSNASTSKTGFRAQSASNGSQRVNWIAIGF